MVLLETWAAGRPTIVNAASEVLVGHCQRSNGGLWYNNYDECADILQSVNNQTKDRLGQQGQRCVKENYSWARAESVYLEALAGKPPAIQNLSAAAGLQRGARRRAE